MRLTGTPSPYLLPTSSKPRFQGNCLSSTSQTEQDQSTALKDLPNDILEKIVGDVLNNPDSDLGTQDVVALGATCKTFRKITQANLRHAQIVQLMCLTHKLWTEAPDKRHLLPLALLSPQNRQFLVNKTLNTSYEPEKSEQIQTLSQQLEHLKPNQRTQLVQAALQIADHESVKIIAVLAQGLQHLPLIQRNQLVEAVLNQSKDILKAYGIARLAQGLQHLLPEQRTQLIQAALNLSNESDKAKAIAGLGQGLQHLPPVQRNQLVQAAINIPYVVYKADAIGGLAQGLQQLSPKQRNQLVEAAINLTNKYNNLYKTTAITLLQGYQKG